MAIDGVTNATSLKMDYMQLLMAQLKNQNPLEPMDNSQMTAQLTSLSQLDQLESMNSNFGMVLQNSQNSYAQSLLGKNVSFYDYKRETYVEANVSKVVNEGSDGIKLVAGDYIIDLDEVAAVSEQNAIFPEGSSGNLSDNQENSTGDQ